MIENLKNEIISCRLCREKFGYEPRPVFWGNENSKIMQISQAPSKAVHLSGKPFDDISGKKLINDWYDISREVFYDPDNFYMTEISHCYPGKSSKGGDNKPDRFCADLWLHKEIEAVKNEIFLLVGRYAATYFFPGEKFSELVFSDRKINGKTAFILPHPSPLNTKWLKDHPDFERQRAREISRRIHRTLGI